MMQLSCVFGKNINVVTKEYTYLRYTHEVMKAFFKGLDINISISYL